MNACAPFCIQLKRIRVSSVNSVDYIDAVDAIETISKQVFSAKLFYIFLLKLLKGKHNLSQDRLTPSESQLLEESANSDYKTANIRLQQGGYQYDLAKGIASFQLEQHFPDVKDLIKKLYGEEKTNDSQFIRKIQTILKKMEKSNIVRILPKNKPWELQRYALSSFKFIDIDKNLVILATPQQIGQTQNLSHSVVSPQKMPTTQPSYIKAKLLMSAFIMVISYTVVLWSLLQPIIKPIIFMPAFFIAVACSLILGKLRAHSQK